MDRCPSCGCDSLFVDRAPAVLYDGSMAEKRVEAYCNDPSCPERFWWYPATGRITRRNTGPLCRYYRPASKEADRAG